MSSQTPMRRCATSLVRVCVVFGLLLCCLASVRAQDKSPQRGFNPGGSYAISDIETLSTTGGNLSLRVPLGGLPAGRGGLSASVNLIYNSKLYDSFSDYDYPNPGNPSPYEVTRLKHSEAGGWRYGLMYTLSTEHRFGGLDAQGVEIAPCSTSQHTVKLVLTTPDGSRHPLFLDGHTDGDGFQNLYPDGSPDCSGRPSSSSTLTYYTTDGTFLRVEVQHDSDTTLLNNPWTIYQPDGGRITGGGNASQRIYDRNNNYVEIVDTFNDPSYGGHHTTKLVDQVGRSVVIEYASASHQDSIHVRGFNNELATTVVRWTSIQVRKTYEAGGPAALNLTLSHRVVEGIDMPAQAGALSYHFAYNANGSNPTFGWGELSAVTLPSGAKATYQYLYDNQTGIAADHVLQNRPAQKQLIYRSEYDLGGVPSNTPCHPQGETCIIETWSFGMEYAPYTSTPIGSTITGPDGGVTTEHFNKNVNGVVSEDGLVYKSERPDGTVVERTWETNRPQSSNFYPPSLPNTYVKYEFTSIRNGSGNLVKTAGKEFTQDKNGNTTQVKEYDWLPYGNVPRNAQGRPLFPSGATLKRVTTNVYHVATPDASDSFTADPDTYSKSSAPALRNAVASGELSDGAQTLTRTEYFYDNPSTTGNVTQQKNWASSKGAYSAPLSAANSVSASTEYNAYGSPILSTDARGTQTHYTYAPVNGYADLYPTTVKVGYQTTAEQVTTTEYDFYTGAVKSTNDPNGIISTTDYDVFGRPTLVKSAAGEPEETRASTSYSDTARRVITRSDLTTTGDARLVSIQHFDQLGRIRLSRRLEDSTTQSETDETTGVKVQTRYLYSGSHSYQLTSNPYRTAYSHQASGNAAGWTRSKADKGGRTVEVEVFEGATPPAPWGANTTGSGMVTSSYDAEFTTVTDQAGKVRRSMTDVFGRLMRVDEPDAGGNPGATGAPAQPTSYFYDAMGNLRRVEQGGQQRFFMYDSLGRLIRTKSPEQGSFTPDAAFPSLTDVTSGISNNQWSLGYRYDDGGNLISRKDARNITTGYQYDALSRNREVDYSDTTVNPDIERHYDNPAAGANGRGRFWYDYKGGNYTVGTEVEHRAVDNYDALGRPLTQRQMFKSNGDWGPPSRVYQVERGYNRAGAVTSQTYPSGRTVSYGYDATGRLSTFSGNLGDWVSRTYANELRYDEAGRMQQERFGTTTGVYNKRFYNVRGQLSEIRVSTYSIIVSGQETNWNRGAIINHYSNYSWAGSGPDNNGNLRKQDVYIPDNEQVSNYSLTTQFYEYDSLNRLDRVWEGRNGTTTWQQNYEYDRWGNRTINAAMTWGGVPAPQFDPVETTTNRLYAPGDAALAPEQRRMRYDAAGNLNYDGYTGMGARAFDAEGRMTSATDTSGETALYTYDADGRRVKRNIAGQETWQAYGIDGELLAEYAAGALPDSPQKEYGYRAGELLVTATTTSSPPAPASLQLSNSSFETPALGTGNFQYHPSGGSWTFINGSGISANSSGFTGGNPPAPHGSQVGFLPTTSSLTQSVDGFQAGQSYVVRFAAAQRGNCCGAGGQDFEVFIDNTSLGVFRPSGTNYVEMTTPGFNVTAGAHTLKFVGKNTSGGDNTVFLDNVRIDPVASVNLEIANRGFESPSLGGSYQYSPAGGAWTFNPSAGITGNNNAFTSGNPSAPEGSQVAFIQTTGSLLQSIGGFEAGASYQVKFMAAQRGNWNNGGQDFEVFIDNTSLGVFRPPGTNYAEMTTNSFNVTAGAHTLKFVGKNSSGGDNTAFIDNVRITATATQGGGGATYSAVGDFSAAQNPSGAWSYGLRASGGAGSFTPYTSNTNVFGAGTDTWSQGGCCPLVVKNTTGATHTYPNAPSVVQPADVLNLHPGPNGEQSVVRWTAPSAGTYSIAGRFEGIDNAWTTSDVSIVHNGSAVLHSGQVNGYGQQSTFSVTRAMAAGETLEFRVGVGSNGTYYQDSTGLAASITEQVAVATGAEIQWIVSDQLGTPRMIVDKSGGLSGLFRHDYLPFGEEIGAGVGGRTTGQGYRQFDGVRNRYTGAERDDETGLDFMQARYYASSQGRFLSPDPLLSSGRVTMPQSWNRYAYTLNNPVKYTDPSGLYEYDRNATEAQKKMFEKALKGITTAMGKLKSGSKEHTRLGNILKAFGKPGEANGVKVAFATTVNGKPLDSAATTGRYQYKRDKVTSYNITVTVNPNNPITTGQAANEGSSVLDFKTAYEAGRHSISKLPNMLNPTRFEREDRSAEAEQIVARALGENVGGELDYEIDGSKEFYLYNKAWEETDAKNPVVNRMKEARLKLLATDSRYQVTPDNPGRRVIEKK